MNPPLIPFIARRVCASLAAAAVLFICSTGIADEPSPARNPQERDGHATIIHRADVIRDTGTNGAGRGHLWPLYSSPEARLNYFEVTGRSEMHFHPDGDHRLYVLEGKVLVTAGTNTTTAGVGDFIVIPRGVRHCYDVPAKGERALLLTFDAPPYDPRKTVRVEASGTGK
jgi:mannose-6-phosphate isomerase-like protein (cupin superfamily)